MDDATPVAGLGDRSPGKPTSVWAPTHSTLYTLRGDQWVTVTYTSEELAPSEAKMQAASLTRMVFQLSDR